MRPDALTDLLQPERLAYASGVERLDDGLLHVAVLTRMPDVSPEMFGWWFSSYLETTEHYKRWHPRDHVWMAWEDKRPGTHLGAKHLVHEYIGGRLQKLRIAFAEPEPGFAKALEETPGAVAVCARTGLLERPVDVGRLVHLALPRPWGCELHSRFWLGDVAMRSGPGILAAVGNRRWARRRAAPFSLGRALLVHCHEEMTTLAGFLSGLYAAETGR